MGTRAADGSNNVTVVDGSAYTGLNAADGSLNVVQVNGSAYTGLYHACGAYNVVLYTTGATTIQHPCGALLVSQAGAYVPNTYQVTTVSGTLS
jgi:hypothetical protein